jgi:hypothetical protein
MGYHACVDTSLLRDILTCTFTDEDLDALAYDHFRPAYDAYANGMSRAAKVHRLIEHAERRGELPRLRSLVGAGGTGPSPLPPIPQTAIVLLWLEENDIAALSPTERYERLLALLGFSIRVPCYEHTHTQGKATAERERGGTDCALLRPLSAGL